jgi:hypothetical protein
MEHEWSKLSSYQSDYTCMPITTTTWEQCRFCRTVRMTFDSPGYYSSPECHLASYSIGEGLIDTQPPCLKRPTNEITLRDEVKALRSQMDDLARKVCLI